MFENKNVIGNEVIIIEVPGIENWTTKELKYTCKHNKVKGYSKMNRDQLIKQVKEIVGGKINE